MSVQMPHRNALFAHLMAGDGTPLNFQGDDADDLRTYLTALNANLQSYLLDGTSLSSVGARLDNGGALFLLLFEAGSEHQQIAVDTDVLPLERAPTAWVRKLQGEDLTVRAQKFIKDIKDSRGDSAVVLVANNGMLFYRPPIDQKSSTYDVSALDAFSIAKSAA